MKKSWRECKMLKYKVGDLLEAAVAGEVNVIAHGCNCYCTMGNGIAPEIKKRFPAAYAMDLGTVKGDPKKLGTFTYAQVWADECGGESNHAIGIYNLYTQFGFWGRNKGLRDLDYNALYNALAAMSEDLSTFDGEIKVGLPKIGAGLAKGDWDIIEMMIKKTLISAGHDVTIYTLE